MTELTILGLDPGTNAMGWGIVSLVQRQERLVNSGVLHPKGKNISQRLGSLYHDLSALFQSHPCHVVAMESVFVHRNVQSTVTLGYARGLALAIAAHHHVDVIDYSPSSIKKGLTGSGRATKEQMQHMIWRLYGHTVPADAADALAVALYHARQVPFALPS